MTAVGPRVKAARVGMAQYELTYEGRTWYVEQHAFRPDRAPWWYRRGHFWHLLRSWDDGLRGRPAGGYMPEPVESFTNLYKAKEYVRTAKKDDEGDES